MSMLLVISGRTCRSSYEGRGLKCKLELPIACLVHSRSSYEGRGLKFFRVAFSRHLEPRRSSYEGRGLKYIVPDALRVEWVAPRMRGVD